MTIAAFASTSFAVAGVHALMLLRHKGNEFHRGAIHIALLFGAVAAILQPLSGDISAKNVAKLQPAKLAAMESLFKTSQPAALVIGGIPDEEKEEVKYGIHIPHLLSFLAHGDLNAEVEGLDKNQQRKLASGCHCAFCFSNHGFYGNADDGSGYFVPDF